MPLTHFLKPTSGSVPLQSCHREMVRLEGEDDQDDQDDQDDDDDE